MEYININDTDSSIWTDLYRPKSINDVVGNKIAVNTIVNWLKSFEKNKKDAVNNNILSKGKKKRTKKIDDVHVDTDVEIDDLDDGQINTSYKNSKKKNGPSSCLLLMGNHGVGKTCTVYAILSELNYDIQTINFSRIQKTDNIKDIIGRLRFSNNTDIISMMDFDKVKKKVLVIDEIESLTSKIDVSCIMALIENNDSKWHYPIIFISNNHHNKSLNDIKKKSLEVHIDQPINDTMMILMNRIVKNEKIKLENIHVANIIIEHSQKDFRRLLNILQDLKYIYDNKIINVADINKYCGLVKKKDIDYDLFRASSDILHGYVGIDNTLKYHETDKVNLPLMVQENYVKGIIDSFECENKLDTALKITESLAKGDIVENYIYGNQNWSIHEVHGYHSCVYPSYILNKYANINNGYKYRLSFPNDLNRTSIKKINKKNITKVSETLKNMNITDYIYINEIVHKLIDENKIAELSKLFSGYGLTPDNIDKLLKIDKIKSTKISLTTKQKKEIHKNLETK